MRRLRLGVIGTGIAFREIHAPVLFQLVDRFEIVALTNRTESRAHEVASWIAEQTGRAPDVYPTPSRMLERDDIDAVEVVVPITLTAQIASQALRNGKHVFAEKPIADNLEDGRNLIKLAHQQKRVLAIGEQFRYQPHFHQVRRLVKSGIVGDSLVYRLNDMHFTYLDDKYPSTAWRREGAFTGGYLIDGGVHTMAGMRSMVDSPVTEVHGLATTFNPHLSGPQNDTLLLNLKFANGMIGQMALGYSAIDHDARHPKVYGRDGTLVLFGDRIEVWRTGRDAPTEIIPIEAKTDGVREEWLDFYNAVANDEPLQHPPSEALADLQVILAGLESARAGKVVSLKSLSH
jgi:predicted dehydrogenase